MLKKYELPIGIFFVATIAFVAKQIQFFPFWPFSVGTPAKHPIEAVLIAILLGILINNIISLPKIFNSGIQFCVKKLLPAAIILLGARLNLQNILSVSTDAILISLGCIVTSFTLTVWLCRRVQINMQLAILIAVGTAICGSAAILVTAPVIKANETDTAISVTIINLFGLIAIFLFPLLGHLLTMPETAFGLWAGTSIQAVPQAIAASFSFGEHAGAIGTITKLIRVLFLAPMIIILSLWQARQHANKTYPLNKLRWHNYIPPFILGFLALIIINSLGWLPDVKLASYTFQTTGWLTWFSSFFLTMALAGIGLKVDLFHLVKGGLKPLAMAGIAALNLAMISWILIEAFIT